MKRNQIFLFTFIALFIIVINSACKKSGNGVVAASNTASSTVNIASMAFTPSTITVKVGTIVTWKNNDGFAHTVTSNDGTSFNSGNLAGGASFKYTTTTTGTFAYHCTIHAGMAGTLIVTQ